MSSDIDSLCICSHPRFCHKFPSFPRWLLTPFFGDGHGRCHENCACKKFEVDVGYYNWSLPT